MKFQSLQIYAISAAVIASFFLILIATQHSRADSLEGTATTTVILSICGDSLVSSGEECDVPGEVGAYSTTILGRQCTPTCLFGPYCGDGILQTLNGEECDDGNNVDKDFCSATCKIEPRASGGGNTTGSSGGGGGGSSVPLGDTAVTIIGKAFPNQSIHILQDGKEIGNVRANSDASFQFSTPSEAGSATFSFWALDVNSTRSTTFSTTFDVTQGAVSTISGIYVPPSIALDKNSVARGEPLVMKGQTVPNATVQINIDSGAVTDEVTSGSDGRWTYTFDTNRVSQASHTIKAKFVIPDAGGTTKRESTFSNILNFGVGVAAATTATNADLNRDGKVNLIDFSILVFWWGTPGGASNPPADINGNAKVGLEDFSILLFNWTG